jgi:hypothetical protein
MSNNNTPDETASKTVEEPIEVDRALWQQLRDEAASNGIDDSRQLEKILKQYFANDDE